VLRRGEIKKPISTVMNPCCPLGMVPDIARQRLTGVVFRTRPEPTRHLGG
jgi:hypothetical protein